MSHCGEEFTRMDAIQPGANMLPPAALDLARARERVKGGPS
jgi:hypothetical protein